MGEPETSLIDMLGRERARLRERTLPALAAALAIQIRAASTEGRYDLRAISSAVGIVVLLSLALAAATVDGLLAMIPTATRAALRTRVRFGPAPAPVFTLPPPITDGMLLDKRGRPLRGAPRTARIAMLERQRAELIALAAAAAPPTDLRVIELPPLPPRLVAAFARARRLSAVAAVSLVRAVARGRARVAPAYARARSAAGALVPLVPVPTLPLRWVRIVAVTTTMTFVFATALGTTGIITQQGRIALGASTTLSILAGDVSAADPGSADLRPVSDGTLLRAGMTIRTGDASYAVLTYFEGSTVSLEPNTTLLIEALEAHPDGTTVISMQQQLGKTWHSVTKLLNQGSKYEVRTPTLTATVRGTAFEVGVARTAAGEIVSSLVTTEGAVGAVTPVAPGDPTPPAEVIVPAGFQATATAGAPIAPPEPAPEPERTVTVTIGTASAVVVDPFGRANGEKDGKLVLQTPGAKVTRAGGNLVVTLPNVPDGKISTVIAPTAQAPVSVATVVADRGKADSRSEETVQVPANATGPLVTGVEVRRSDAAPAEVRVLAPDEKKDAPAPKVVEPVKPTARPELLPSLEKKDEPKDDGAGPAGPGGGPRVSTVVDVFVKATLPPLSIEEAARRAEESRKAEERAREEAAKREEERRRENERRADEARRAEEAARQEAEKRSAERRLAEEKAREELSRRNVARAEQTARGGGSTPGDGGLALTILRALAPGGADDDARRESEKRAEEARQAEAKAREEAEKRAEERRKAEGATRSDQLRRAEEERQQAEKRAEEIRRAEEKAREEAAREIARIREIEAKAREQAQRLEEEKRREAEKRIDEFRRAEEKAREDAAKRLDEQRRAEERAKADAERRIAELRAQQERAREEAERYQREQEERRREEQRRSEERAREERDRSNFIPSNTLDPLPGRIGSAGRGGSGRP